MVSTPCLALLELIPQELFEIPTLIRKKFNFLHVPRPWLVPELCLPLQHPGPVSGENPEPPGENRDFLFPGHLWSSVGMEVRVGFGLRAAGKLKMPL